VKMTRLSCHRFRSNEVRLWLSPIAYNLGSLWRRLVLPKEDRRLVADQLAATAGEDRRQTDQARPVLLAESHLRRRLFGAMLGRIESLPLPAR